MSRNVRCAGGGQWYETWEDAEIGADRNVPCGWKGERFTQPPDGDYGMDWAAAEARARTTKPCPQCGGRVELIPEST